MRHKHKSPIRKMSSTVLGSRYHYRINGTLNVQAFECQNRAPSWSRIYPKVLSSIRNPINSRGEKCQDIKNCNIDINHETEKVAVVEVPDAIIDPRAVMIHSKHTSFACSAVVSARRLEVLADLAVAWRVLELFGFEVHSFWRDL